ncbi:MAG: ATP-binding cassette domain-containing protein [Proteobacteria bacterium]|nr:ATP-binding cassette domain-containing protein [Pseudomonadota bacterium]
MKIRNATLNEIWIQRFDAHARDVWFIWGSDNSGLEEFFRLISGEAGEDARAEQLDLPDNIGVVSFKKQQELYESELKKNDTDYLNKIDPGTQTMTFLEDLEKYAGLIEAFGMTASLDKGYRQLSTGQSRKLMILSQISKGVSCLVIQSPYDGLDPKSCQEMNKALFHLHQQKTQLIIFVNNTGDIPSWCTHVGVMSHGRLAHQGGKQEIMGILEQKLHTQSPDFQASVQDLYKSRVIDLKKNSEHKDQTQLVRLNKGFAGYEGATIFKDLSLSISQGDHTLVTGPNGCGKSTLLQVITGDHPACYQNDLKIFGIQRGTGESIWALKQHMGIVSSELHRNYNVPGTTLHCIISGLFDSIGLYRPYSNLQEQKAMTWLGRLNMDREARTPFRLLEYAQQRLALIARALIKVPRLLILDEPTQGLDESNRKAVLNFLEDVAKEDLCTILYVSHREDEYRSFFNQHLRM